MPENHEFKLKTPDLTPPPPKVKVTPIEESTEVKEPVQKQESKDRPYSASYFDVPAWGELILNPEMDTFNLKEKSVYIDDFLSRKLTANGMKKDSETYSNLLSELETYLHLDRKLHEPIYRITKVFNMLKTIEHANEENERRRRYLESILSKA